MSKHAELADTRERQQSTVGMLPVFEFDGEFVDGLLAEFEAVERALRQPNPPKCPNCGDGGYIVGQAVPHDQLPCPSCNAPR